MNVVGIERSCYPLPGLASFYKPLWYYHWLYWDDWVNEDLPVSFIEFDMKWDRDIIMEKNMSLRLQF